MTGGRRKRDGRRAAREKAERARLSEETRGLDDCGRAGMARYADGCRCRSCVEAASEYRRCYRDRKRREKHGAPAEMLDAKPVKKRIETLREAGYTLDEISRLSGLQACTLKSILGTRGSKPPEKVHRSTKDAVFSIKSGMRSIRRSQLVECEWIAGWFRDYIDAGLSASMVAKAVGVSRKTVANIASGRQKTVRSIRFRDFLLAKPGLDREMRAMKEAKRGWSRRA